jgi:hypothetical protein
LYGVGRSLLRINQKLILYANRNHAKDVQYIDRDGNIIVPKSVRPIIDYKETLLGNKKGAKRQYRYGNLHIREYDDYYTIHRDKIDPRKDRIGHLLADAPEYLAGAVSATYIGYKIGQQVYNRRKARGKNQRTALHDATLAGFLAGSTAGLVSHLVSNTIRKDRCA